jgi:DNA-binding NarL/FixJ family response regulator
MVHLGGTYFQREVEKQKAKLPQADNEKLIKFAKLTIREKQVIRQISDGFSTKDIADSLKLSIRTVEEYRENVRKKMDAKSIPNMIRIVCENNLLDEL